MRQVEEEYSLFLRKDSGKDFKRSFILNRLWMKGGKNF